MTKASTKIEHVLLVDDDANIRLIVQMTIEGLTDWKLTVAESGTEALQLLEAQRPDLVLLDIMMPDIDGTMIFETIKERFQSQVPVIFMTAKVQSQEIRKLKTLGVAGVIVKPFDPMELIAQVQTILGIL